MRELLYQTSESHWRSIHQLRVFASTRSLISSFLRWPPLLYTKERVFPSSQSISWFWHDQEFFVTFQSTTLARSFNFFYPWKFPSSLAISRNGEDFSIKQSTVLTPPLASSNFHDQVLLWSKRGLSYQAIRRKVHVIVKELS